MTSFIPTLQNLCTIFLAIIVLSAKISNTKVDLKGMLS